MTARPETGYTVDDDARDHADCIEIRNWRGEIRTMSVRYYNGRLSFARHLGNDRALDFHDLWWALQAPPPERLTREWQQPSHTAFRISDWETYVWQMQRLLGLR